MTLAAAFRAVNFGAALSLNALPRDWMSHFVDALRFPTETMENSFIEGNADWGSTE